MYLDTHCHLHDREFFSESEAEKILKDCEKSKVTKIICIGTNPDDSFAARDFADSHKGVFWTFGIHPEYAKETLSKNSTFLPSLESSRSLVAIGEIGLDYHYSRDSRSAQLALFESMLDLAEKLHLPVSLHVREAFDDFFGVIKNHKNLTGVVHSFSDSKKNLAKILNETDFYIGVNGLATYSTLPTPPLSRIVLETDAPFLTPVPKRGIINSPAYIPYIAEFLAKKLDESIEKVAKETTKNGTHVFHLPDTVKI